MKQLITLFTFLFIGGVSLFSQNEFEVTEGTKGVFVPRLTQTEICNMTITAADDGLLVYNTSQHKFMHVCAGCDPNGDQWMIIESSWLNCAPTAAGADAASSQPNAQERITHLEKQIAALSRQINAMK